MKKAFYTILTAMTLVTVLVACKKNDDGGQPATVATTPVLNCNIPQQNGTVPTACNPGVYHTAAPVFIDYNWTGGNGFCGCQPGYRPVMNPQWGISCAPDTWIGNIQYGGSGSYYGGQYGSQYSASGYIGFSFQQVYYSSQNYQYSSIPQVTYSPAISNSYAGNCYSQALAVCDTRIANSCTGGGICRPTAGGSYIGLCTNGVGTDYYNNPQSNCYRWNGYSYVNVCAYGYPQYGGGYQNGNGGLLPR